MKFIEYTAKLDKLKYMAERHSTGSPRQLAHRFNVSERTIQRMVQQLRDHGYPIIYDRLKSSYIKRN